MNRKVTAYLMVLILALLLPGCGGGGGGGTTNLGPTAAQPQPPAPPAPPANSPPVADAGEDGTAARFESWTLDGTGSSDADGDALAYRWTVSSSPPNSTATLLDAAAARPSFMPDRYGTYQFELIVNDGQTDSAPSRTNVTVEFWRQTSGPLGGQTGPIIVTGDGTAVVATQNSVYRSTNGGSSWEVALFDAYVTQLVVNSHDEIIATGLPQGLFRISADAGLTWTSVRAPYTETMTALALGAGDEILAGTYGGRLLRSADNGQSWFSFQTDQGRISAIAQLSGGRILAVGADDALVSADGGMTWTALNAELPQGAMNVLTVGAHGRLYAATNNGIYRSADEALTWERLAVNTSVVRAITTDAAGTLFAADSRVFKSLDGGDNWSLHTFIGQGEAVRDLVTTGSTIYAATYKGVFRADTTTLAWQRVNRGLRVNSVREMAADASGRLFVGSEVGGLRTSDRGASWESIWDLGIVDGLAVSPAGMLFLNTNAGGMFRSTNGGNSYSGTDGLDGNLGRTSFAFDSGGRTFAVSFKGVFRSYDSGENWSEVLDVLHAGVIAVDTHDRVYVGVNGTDRVLYQSLDGGENWTPLEAPFPTSNFGINSIAVGANNQVFVAVGGGMMYRSRDQGATWELLETAAGLGTVLRILVDAENNLYAGGFNGFFYSSDGGDSWQALSEGLDNPALYTIGIDAAGYAYAGTAGDSVYVSVEPLVQALF